MSEGQSPWAKCARDNIQRRLPESKAGRLDLALKRANKERHSARPDGMPGKRPLHGRRRLSGRVQRI